MKCDICERIVRKTIQCDYCGRHYCSECFAPVISFNESIDYCKICRYGSDIDLEEVERAFLRGEKSRE
jgi:hypothetical protein